MSIARSLNMAVALLILNAVALRAGLLAQTPVAATEGQQPRAALTNQS